MGYTIRQIVTRSIKEVLKTGDDFTPSPEDLSVVSESLNCMMAEWNNSGLRMSYPIVSNPDLIDLDTETGIPPGAIRAVLKNLALEIHPIYDINPSRETKVSAKSAYNSLFLQDGIGEIKERQMDSMIPIGAGYKYHRCRNYPFFPNPRKGLQLGKGGDLEVY